MVCGLWILLTTLALALFVLALPVYFEQLQTVCEPPGCLDRQLVVEQVADLRALGLSPRFYATYLTGLSIVFAATYAATGLLIFARRSDEPLPLLTSLILVLFGATFTGSFESIGTSGILGQAALVIYVLGFVLAVLFLNLFPSGRFVPRYARWFALVWIIDVVTARLVQSVADPPAWLGALNFLGFFVPALFSLGAQAYRYRRVSDPAQRQQIKWVVFGIGAALSGTLAISLAVTLFPTIAGRSALAQLITGTGFVLSMLFIPLALTFAILLHRLWDIDPLINRTLVYGALTACVIGWYVLIVGSLGVLFGAWSGQPQGLPLQIVAAGIVAVLFQPLRERIQRGVNRLLYGERDEPYVVLSRLGARLEATFAREAVLTTIVETVKGALKLPYAAAETSERENVGTLERSDAPDLLRLPLTYGNETVGHLVLAPRDPGTSFSPADLRLLEDLARQAGVAVQAGRLTAELQRERERLVSAREEGRRRLRRDLHDGLGPALAAQMLKVGSARALLARDPDTANRLLSELERDLKEALADVRRLVYNLRPPALDDLGPLGAVFAHIEQLQSDRLNIMVEAREPLPPLPAAVEVAAYRIAQEALTNVVRHADARRCTVRFALESNGLRLDIFDDGTGVPSSAPSGVGLTSMRERAKELGGTLKIAPGESSGTAVTAWLPLTADPKDFQNP